MRHHTLSSNLVEHWVDPVRLSKSKGPLTLELCLQVLNQLLLLFTFFLVLGRQLVQLLLQLGHGFLFGKDLLVLLLHLFKHVIVLSREQGLLELFVFELLAQLDKLQGHLLVLGLFLLKLQVNALYHDLLRLLFKGLLVKRVKHLD